VLKYLFAGRLIARVSSMRRMEYRKYHEGNTEEDNDGHVVFITRNNHRSAGSRPDLNTI
jgi:hypothetical protein